MLVAKHIENIFTLRFVFIFYFMNEQQKIFRVLRLIGLLADKPSRTVKELSKIVEASEKTVYRYLELLEELGYHVDKDQRNAYFIFESEPSDPSSFEPEELQLLNQLIGAIEGENPLKESLRKKLYLSSTLVPLSEELVDKHMAKIVQRLSNAIEEKKQCRLLRYQSATSDTPKDRWIEPVSFAKNNSQLCAFDLDKQEVRHFKIKRIEDVEILNATSTHLHILSPTDIFGFPSEQTTLVKLQLSTRAYQLLVEEFPESKRFVSHVGENAERPYRFVYEVRSLIGIGRFILGLPGEIAIESPVELKEYLKKRVTEFALS